MKKPEHVEDMTARLVTAATTPALTIVREQPPIPKDTPKASSAADGTLEPRKAGRPPNSGGKSVAVFLKVPPETYAKLEAEAVKRTKQTGKGVTVQQIILERC